MTTVQIIAMMGAVASPILTAWWAWFKEFGPGWIMIGAWVGFGGWLWLTVGFIFLVHAIRRWTIAADYDGVIWLSEVVEEQTIGKWWQEAWRPNVDLQVLHSQYGKWKRNDVFPEMAKRLGRNFANEYARIGDLTDWVRTEDQININNAGANIRPIIRRDMRFLRSYVTRLNRKLLID